MLDRHYSVIDLLGLATKMDRVDMLRILGKACTMMTLKKLCRRLDNAVFWLLRKGFLYDSTKSLGSCSVVAVQRSTFEAPTSLLIKNLGIAGYSYWWCLLEATRAAKLSASRSIHCRFGADRALVATHL